MSRKQFQNTHKDWSGDYQLMASDSYINIFPLFKSDILTFYLLRKNIDSNVIVPVMHIHLVKA